MAKWKVVGLLDRMVAVHGLQLPPDLRPAIEEMLLLDNVVRHGDGPSCSALRKVAPSLWVPGPEAFEQAMPASPLDSNGLRIGPDELHRYASALFRFWGAADTSPMATVDAPY